MNVVRTITVAVLFVCILVPVVTPVCLQIKQLYIQHEMLEKMEKTALISIRVKSNNIQWIKPGKECVIAGEMFDVKQIKQEGDELLLTGLYDVKEKELKKLAAAHSQEKSKQSRYTIQLLTLVLTTPENFNLQPVLVVNNKRHPFISKTPPLNPYIGYITPPPRYDA